MKKDIPLHRLQDTTMSWLNLQHISQDTPLLAAAGDIQPHRDDHYLFFLVEAGSCKIMVDFEEVTLGSHDLFYILPTQVHHRLEDVNGEGWFIAVDQLAVPRDCRDVFETELARQRPVRPDPGKISELATILSMLSNNISKDHTDRYYKAGLLALLQSFLYLSAAILKQSGDGSYTPSRTGRIASDFTGLLKKNVRAMKSPAAYAAALNISPAYLNEVLKKATGYPVSYWIQQEMINEARRLLYHTHLSVKEIASLLGYDDYSYFSRIFHKVSGQSAAAFRQHYHK